MPYKCVMAISVPIQVICVACAFVLAFLHLLEINGRLHSIQPSLLQVAELVGELLHANKTFANEKKTLTKRKS